MHLCAFFVVMIQKMESQKLKWLQKKDLPTIITFNIFDDSFLLTVQCPNNIPLFKTIIKSLIQQFYDPSMIREASSYLKLAIPEFFKIVEVTNAEKQLEDLLFTKLTHYINILYGRNATKIEEHI